MILNMFLIKCSRTKSFEEERSLKIKEKLTKHRERG